MAENMVRCSRCHEVFDAEVGPCPKCGTPYRPPAAQPKAYDGLYTERYAPAVSASPEETVVAPPIRRRDNTGLFVGGGAALILSAVVVAILVGLGALGGPSVTAAPRRVVPVTMPPSPTPTLPPAVSNTLQQLNDLKLSAKITVDSHVTLSASAGQSQTIIVKFDGQVSNGNEWGTLQSAGISQEIRLVNGEIYARVLPAGKWTKYASVPSYLVICPVFGLKSAADLQLVGPETKDGKQLNHLQSTSSWNFDLNRIAMADLSSLPYWPPRPVLDLWVTTDGTPVSATFSGSSMATNGTKLLDVQVTYTFADVGVAASIDVPGPNWSPSPTPTR
jgi:hypothetical protein